MKLKTHMILTATPEDDGSLCFYIIKTGHMDTYFVIEDNAFADGDYSKCKPMNAEMIRRAFGINIEIAYPSQDYNTLAAQERSGELTTKSALEPMEHVIVNVLEAEKAKEQISKQHIDLSGKQDY